MSLPQGQRRFERAPFFTRVTITGPSGEPATEARTVDVGLAGVGVITTTPLAVGQAVLVTFHLRVGTGMVREQVPGRVVDLRVDDDASIAGIEFDEPVSRLQSPALVRAIERL
jgi:hypothetical protein